MHVVGDTVLGIGMIAFDEVELVVPAVAEPAVDEVIVEPGAPAALDRRAKVHLGDAEEHTDGKNTEIKSDRWATAAVSRSCMLSKMARFHAFIAYAAPTTRRMTNSNAANSIHAL